ncbi:Gfo/Idh/MocA family protein [Herbiconiux sp. P17]|uniref:Gfo/Idh/MocA family protein n=1 Tax=Herbiconiux wuyangfengii TaxID=3342794 RepID=UPI0035BAF5C7
MPETRPRRVAISGLGSIARQHVAAFAALGGVEIVAFDPSTPLREEALAGGRVSRAVADFDELLDLEPTALVVAAPDFAHLDQLSRATARGIPVLVEKPLAVDFAAAASVIDEIEGRGVPVLVGYVLRHRRVVETVRRLVLESAIGVPGSFQVMLGAYGTITAAASRFATPEPNRVYRDYSHEWDYLRWIFGPIREVTAVARTLDAMPHVESPNLVDGLLVLESGVSGAVHVDYVEPRGTRTLHIVGSEGALFADIGRGTIALRRGGEVFDRAFDLAEPASVPLGRQAAHLLAVASGAEQPRVGLRDGLAALAVTDALIRSAADRSWVAVPGEAS